MRAGSCRPPPFAGRDPRPSYARKEGTKGRPAITQTLAPWGCALLAAMGLVCPFEALQSLALAGNLFVWDDAIPESSGMFSRYGLGSLIDRRECEALLLSTAKRLGISALASEHRCLQSTTTSLGGFEFILPGLPSCARQNGHWRFASVRDQPRNCPVGSTPFAR